MTMDIQKYNHRESSPGVKARNAASSERKPDQYQMKKNELQYISSMAPNKVIKRSFDVAFLMLPDDKLRQRQTEKQLRVSKQLFANREWECGSAIKEHNLSVKNSEYGGNSNVNSRHDEIINSCSYNESVHYKKCTSPTFGQELNIDVGTDEYPSKSVYSDSDVSERSRSRPNSNESASRLTRFLPESPYKNKVFDDPTLIIPSRTRYEHMSKYCLDKSPDNCPRSAFTKVLNHNTSNFPINISPDPSVSPDNLLYQNSISPPLSSSSPSANIYNKSASFKSILSPNHPFMSAGHPFFKAHNLESIRNAHNNAAHYMDNNQQQMMHHHNNTSGSPYTKTHMHEYPTEKHVDVMKQVPHPNKSNNLSPIRPDFPTYLQAGSTYPFGVPNFHAPGGDFMKFPMQSSREPMNSLISNPAAAILSTLLPPSLAAFSLPAQNVCAKCNISFRMTSDLVYHMRTHHKSEVTSDPNRRKREEKLKCPVCAESFRERHHLTRHMTAHQDKEGDLREGEASALHGAYGKSKNKSYYVPKDSLHNK